MNIQTLDNQNTKKPISTLKRSCLYKGTLRAENEQAAKCIEDMMVVVPMKDREVGQIHGKWKQRKRLAAQTDIIMTEMNHMSNKEKSVDGTWKEHANSEVGAGITNIMSTEDQE